MIKKYRVYYDEQRDRLMIASKSDSDIMAGSIRMLNIILDFNRENKVVNAELLHASEYLKSLGLRTNILKNITAGSLSFKQLRNGYEMAFILKSGKDSIVVPYNVQLPNQKQIVINSA